VNDTTYTSVLTAIGEKLAELRKQKGYTSYERFAFDHDLPRVHYWRIEKGKVNVTLKSLTRILAIHNVSVEEFFCLIHQDVDL
jgi:transcriptional regulator with XRE-family HTH domain